MTCCIRSWINVEVCIFVQPKNSAFASTPKMLKYELQSKHTVHIFCKYVMVSKFTVITCMNNFVLCFHSY